MIARPTDAAAGELQPPVLCGRCKERPAIPGRDGPRRCTECVAQALRRALRPRSRVLNPRRLRAERVITAAQAEIETVLDPGDLPPRPVLRAQCRGEPRPCPWVSCKHHLYLDADPKTGAITLNFPDLEPWELKETCSLDIAERGPQELRTIAAALNMTGSRVGQIERRALARARETGRDPDGN